MYHITKTFNMKEVFLSYLKKKKKNQEKRKVVICKSK